MSVRNVLWVGQRATAGGVPGTVVALDVPCEEEDCVGLRLDGTDPEWLGEDYICFPYSQVRPL